MGLETIVAVAALTSATVSTASAIKSNQEQKKAVKEQKKLQKTREDELANEEIARQQAQKKAASSGTRVGRGSLTSPSITGMGTQMAPPISSRSTLFGN